MSDRRSRELWTTDEEGIPRPFERPNDQEEDYDGWEPPQVEVGSSVVKKPIHFLWHPYIPLNAITVMSGEGGLGKSHSTVDLAARVTTGKPFPGSNKKRPPRNVLMIAGEDTSSEIIMPRFAALGGDEDRVHIINRVFQIHEQSLQWLHGQFEKINPQLTILDPWSSFFASIDIDKSNQVLAALNVLNEFVYDQQRSLVIIRHTRKSGGRGKHRGLGSTSINANVRSELLVTEDFDDRDLSLMMHIKTNWGPHGPSLAFKAGKDFEWEGKRPYGEERVHELDRPGDQTKQDDATDWLIGQLENGPQKISDLKKSCDGYSFSWATVEKAKQKNKAIRRCTIDGKNAWRLRKS